MTLQEIISFCVEHWEMLKEEDDDTGIQIVSPNIYGGYDVFLGYSPSTDKIDFYPDFEIVPPSLHNEIYRMTTSNMKAFKMYEITPELLRYNIEQSKKEL